jgi:hypothetical protein
VTSRSFHGFSSKGNSLALTRFVKGIFPSAMRFYSSIKAMGRKGYRNGSAGRSIGVQSLWRVTPNFSLLLNVW